MTRPAPPAHSPAPPPSQHTCPEDRVFSGTSRRNSRPGFATPARPSALRRGTTVLALALSLVTPALADPPAPAPDPLLGQPLSAAEFEAEVTGRTLTYQSDGVVWGKEQYLPGRRVIWAFTGQPCEEGRWHAEGAAICFVYEVTTGPNCWLFFHDDNGLVARVLGGGSRMSEVARSPSPLDCGPRVGV